MSEVTMKILVVESDRTVSSILLRLIKKRFAQARLRRVRTLAAAEIILLKENINLIICDTTAPAIGKQDLLEQICSRHPTLHAIVMMDPFWNEEDWSRTGTRAKCPRVRFVPPLKLQELVVQITRVTKIIGANAVTTAFKDKEHNSSSRSGGKGGSA